MKCRPLTIALSGCSAVPSYCERFCPAESDGRGPVSPTRALPDTDDSFHIKDPAGYDLQIAGKNLMSAASEPSPNLYDNRRHPAETLDRHIVKSWTGMGVKYAL